MAFILMCKNKEVYNINTAEIYNPYLLPGLMIMNGASREAFKKWLKTRYSSNTNSLARQLKGVIFGQGSRETINKVTRALSLSDCYWIKQSGDNIQFEQISPYYNNFWTGAGAYSGESIPTLYVSGYMNKEWISANTLVKYGNTALNECNAIELCKLCSINVNNSKLLGIDGIAVENITNGNIMLETAEASGKFDEDNFTDEDIVAEFGLKGAQMVIIDAIVGNGDRHLGNFGYLRDANTGIYLDMAPLYDFDHALDAKGTEDRLIRNAKDISKSNKKYWNECRRICETVINKSNQDIFRKRAERLYGLL